MEDCFHNGGLRRASSNSHVGVNTRARNVVNGDANAETRAVESEYRDISPSPFSLSLPRTSRVSHSLDPDGSARVPVFGTRAGRSRKSIVLCARDNSAVYYFSVYKNPRRETANRSK